MDVATFKAVIAANGGEDKVLGIQFDNGPSFLYNSPLRPAYSHAAYLDETNEVITSNAVVNLSGKTFIVVKPVECVQGILFTDGGNLRTDYDSSSLSSV